MASEPEKSTPASYASPNRLWAEQLAMGLALLMGLLIFMACFHPKMLSAGSKILGPNYLSVYGWAAVFGIVLQLVIHELASLLVAWKLKLPLHFRLFPFGANATAVLEYLPRETWRDAVVGLTGPMTGSLISMALGLLFRFTYDPDNLHSISPLFLGMACVGYFYNLFTLIPILDLEGGWIAPAIAPEAWLVGIVAGVLELTHNFNLILLCVVCFALPRFVLLIRARAPRMDLNCTGRQRLMIGLGYFALIVILAWLGSTIFEELTRLIPEAMGD